MKHILTILVLSSLTTFACNDEAIEFADKLVQKSENKFEAGLTSITDVYESKSYAARLRLCKNKTKELCSEALSTSQAALKATSTGFEVGARTMADVINAHNEIVKIEEQCQ